MLIPLSKWFYIVFFWKSDSFKTLIQPTKLTAFQPKSSPWGRSFRLRPSVDRIRPLILEKGVFDSGWNSRLIAVLDIQDCQDFNARNEIDIFSIDSIKDFEFWMRPSKEEFWSQFTAKHAYESLEKSVVKAFFGNLTPSAVWCNVQNQVSLNQNLHC